VGVPSAMIGAVSCLRYCVLALRRTRVWLGGRPVDEEDEVDLPRRFSPRSLLWDSRCMSLLSSTESTVHDSLPSRKMVVSRRGDVLCWKRVLSSADTLSSLALPPRCTSSSHSPLPSQRGTASGDFCFC
jgi:hypothetical protein